MHCCNKKKMLVLHGWPSLAFLVGLIKKMRRRRMLSRNDRLQITNDAMALGFPNRWFGAIADESSARLLMRFITMMNRNSSRSIRFLHIGAFNEGPGSGAHRFRFTVLPNNARGPGALTREVMRSLSTLLRQVFRDMSNFVIWGEALQPTSRFMFSIHDTNNNRFVSTSMMKVHDFKPKTVFDLILSILQSNQNLDLSSVRVEVIWARKSGIGGYYEGCLEFMKYAQSKRCIVKINPHRDDCVYQCLVLFDAYKTSKTLYKKYVSHRSLLEKATIERFGVCERVGLQDFTTLECSIDLRIVLIEFQTLKVLHEGNMNYDDTCYMLCEYKWGEGHVHFINPDKVGSLWGRSKFCLNCMKGYRDMEHVCELFCPMCRSQECNGVNYDHVKGTLQCTVCKKYYYGEACLERHIMISCKDSKRCTTCSAIYKKKEKHECYMNRCKNCYGYYRLGESHHCYHKVLKYDHLPKVNLKYIFFDYECAFKGNEHIPAGIVALYAEGDEVFEFKTTDEFLGWCITPKHKGYTLIAHNGGRYDFQFVKQGLLKYGMCSSDLVRGNGYMCITINKPRIRFVDSIKFIPMGLRKFPKMFGIESVSKGFFPYRFFTTDRLDYVGPLPDLSYFEIDKMDEETRTCFNTWYHSYDGVQVNLYRLCMDYCIDDVKLLKAGCLIFRKEYLDITQNSIDPFKQVTIAGSCLKAYQLLDMPKRSIAVLHDQGEEQYWKERLLFQRYVESKGYVVSMELPFIVARKEGHAIVLKVCLFNGCSMCYTRFRRNPFNFQPMYELEYAFKLNVQNLTQEGVDVEVIPECVWREDCFTKVTLESSIRQPLCLRDGFYGGRTEPFKLYRKVQEGEKIRYWDYRSLYPSLLMGETYPILVDSDNQPKPIEFPEGHPVRITDNFEPLETYFGFVFCRVHPPETELYIPLLPYRSEGKLVFDNTKKTGVWTTIELMKAVSLGYTIVEVYEVYHFKRRSTRIFRKYIERFYELKLRASGWTKLGIEEVDEQMLFLNEVYKRSGLHLHPDDIVKNAGKYAVSKLCLNSLWGKYAQKAVAREVYDTFERESFEELIFSDEHTISDVILHTPEIRTVCVQKKREFLSDPLSTNVALAAFTTAHARLRLYEAMEAVGEDLLYCDTDSIIFVDHGSCPLKTGPHLGDLADELEMGEYIEEFVSTGPKSYAYVTNMDHEVCKVKGFSLSGGLQDSINFDAMKDLVLNPLEIAKTIVVQPMQFDIHRDHTITTKEWGEQGKAFRLTSNKRMRTTTSDVEVNTHPFNK